MSISELYKVHIGEYAEDHFMKSFSKNYKTARDITLRAIRGFVERIDNFLLTTKAEKIHSCGRCHIVKCEFAVAGTKESPHSSGNRYIVHMDQENHECRILLVYAKTDVKGGKGKETVWRQSEIKKNYPALVNKFTGF